MQSQTGPSVADVAGRFAIAGIAGWVILSVFLRLGGVLALTIPAVTWFAGAFWAAGDLRLGIRGRVGFGTAVTMGTFASMLILIGTQGMKSTENLVVTLTVPLVIANTLAALLGLLFLPGWNAFVYGVLGFSAGAAAAGVIAGVGVQSNSLNIYVVLALTQIPGIVGGAAAAWALRGSSSPT